MANNDDTLIREVQEELRRERMQQVWDRYGTYLLAAALALVLGVGGYQAYVWQRTSAANSAGTAYEKATYLADDGKADEALAAYRELAQNAPAGYAALARLKVAAAEFKAGRKAEALAAYEALAAQSAADPLLRSFAKLQATSLKIGDLDFTEVENRLNDLVKAEGPWRANARELLAVAALRAGRVDQARSVLEQVLADRTSPASVRERAQVLMSQVVAADLAKAPAEKAASAASEAPQAGTTGMAGNGATGGPVPDASKVGASKTDTSKQGAPAQN